MEAAPSNGELHIASVWLIHVEHDYALVFDYDYGFPNPPLSPLGLDALAHEWP